MLNQSVREDDDQPPGALPLRVSIGLPVFNAEAFLSQAIESLLGQTYVDFELIISDNASTDSTESICRKYMLQDSRISYFRNPKNVGPIANFQQVFRASRGEFFMWAAHDDLWEPEFIEELVELLEKSPDTALAFCRFDNIDADARSVRQYDLKNLIGSCDNRTLRNFLMQDESRGKANLIMGLMRRQVLLEAKSFHLWSGRFWYSDVLVVFRILSLGRLQLSDRFLFHKRLQVNSAGNAKRRMNTPREQMIFHRRHLKEWKIYCSTYHKMIDYLRGRPRSTIWYLHMVLICRDSMQRIKIFRAMLQAYRRRIRDKLFRKHKQDKKVSPLKQSRRAA